MSIFERDFLQPVKSSKALVKTFANFAYSCLKISSRTCTSVAFIVLLLRRRICHRKS
jgi:hypothetical protein